MSDAEPFGRRRVGALHDHVGRVGDAAAVAVRILRPRLDDVVREYPRVHRADELLAIELLLERQVGRIDGDESRPERAIGVRVGGVACRGRVVEAVVVGVNAELRRL